MIHIFTLKFGDKYPVSLVNDLFLETKRNDVKFYCYTDNNLNLHSGIITIPLQNKLHLHWNKIDFFKKDFVKYLSGDQCIIMDIDQIIVDNVDPLIYYPVEQNQLVTYQAWDDGPCKINGGWYKFNAGEMHHVYEKFYSNPEYYQLEYYNMGVVDYKYFGEQNFVEDSVRNIKYMPAEYYSGRHTTSSARIIHYSGPKTQILY